MIGYKLETQNRWELDKFLEFIADNKINVYCEIGLYSGSTFKEVYDTLLKVHGGDHSKFKMIGIDLPTNTDAFAECSRVVENIPNATCYWTSSTDPDTVEKVWAEVKSFNNVAKVYGSSSLIFIDGDHSFVQAKDDFDAYGAMFSFTAFNDIDQRTVEQNKRKHGGRDIATVYHFYEGLRRGLVEDANFCDERAEKARGIGILR